MLYLLLAPLRGQFPLFNVLRYPSFRAVSAFLLALAICIVLGPRFISWLQQQKFGQVIRSDGPETHFNKKNTPTMGGALMLVGITVATLLFGDLTSPYVMSALFVTLAFGFVGFFDDWAKIKRRSTAGISGRVRLAAEFGISMAMVTVLTQVFDFGTTLAVPFLKDTILHVDLGWAYIPFTALVIVGTANAANLTDGLDGLCIGQTIVSAGTFTALAYGAGVAIGGFNIAQYLRIPNLPGAVELVVFSSALAGAGIGFLWYNCHPAEFFMGDTGSLSLGGALGMLAVLTKNELLSVIINGVFVAEAASVILQVGWFKYTKRKYGEGRRIFRMTPLHHHFEKLGWPETKVVTRFWIMSVILAAFGLATLKLR
jgi:phospho-N-acetylmuramoyl-pentapeptide-transferase